MLKRGILFLLVFTILLHNSLAQDVCYQAHPDSVGPVAQKILTSFSQLDLPEGTTPQQAAIDALYVWQPEDPSWNDLKSEIITAILQGTVGCIDGYSLNSIDDCWNDNGFCIGGECVKFEYMGWDEEVLDKINKLWSQDNSQAYSAISQLMSFDESKLRETTPVLIKLLESNLDNEIKSLILLTLSLIPTDKAAQALIRVSESHPEPILRERAKLFTVLTRPPVVLGQLREQPLFESIYTHEILSQFSETEKNSISISVYRQLLKEESNPSTFEIENAIDNILDKRRIFEDKIILGKSKYMIIFSAERYWEDVVLVPNLVESYASKKGVRFAINQNLWHVRDPIIRTSKQDIKDTIINSKEEGETVIWSNTHGLRDYICLKSGETGTTGECFGLKYDEYADILLERGNLDEVILILESCLSYDYAEQLLENLREKNSPNYPLIITTSNKGRASYPVFTPSLIRLHLNGLLKKDEPLLGRHIYEAEQFSFSHIDSAVFFSETETDFPQEIAMNSLNQNACGCTGDSCPIDLNQGIFL